MHEWLKLLTVGDVRQNRLCECFYCVAILDVMFHELFNERLYDSLLVLVDGASC